MNRNVSLGTMISQLGGLSDKDLSDFERKFVSDITDRTKAGLVTSMLTEKQIGVVESIYRKHFA